MATCVEALASDSLQCGYPDAFCLSRAVTRRSVWMPCTAISFGHPANLEFIGLESKIDARAHRPLLIDRLASSPALRSPPVRTAAGTGSNDQIQSGNKDQESSTGATSQASGDVTAERTVRWLDRARRLGAAGDRDMPRSDVLKKSYSTKERRKTRPWWQRALLTIWAAGKTATGVAMTGASFGMLTSAMKLSGVLLTCFASYGGVKLAVSGVDSFIYLADPTADRSDPGTTSYLWTLSLSAFLGFTTLCAYSNFAASAISTHAKALQATYRHISRLHLRLQATKVAAHAGNELNNALRSTAIGRAAGDTIDQTLGAMEEAMGNAGMGSMNDAIVSEAKEFVGASLKLPASYVACATLILGPVAAMVAAAPLLQKGAMTGMQSASALHSNLVRQLEERRCGKSAPWLAAALQAALYLAVTKPFGFCGNSLYSVPKLLIPKEINFLGLDVEISSFKPT